jgi:cob(I)alamin adenosyltransferase
MRVSCGEPTPTELGEPQDPVSNRSPIDSVVATTKGDDGTTGLLYGGARIGKDDPRTEAYGTIDEAIAALGVARANLGIKRGHGTLPAGLGGLAPLILRFQRELFVAGAELATNPDAWDRLQDGVTRVSDEMVRGVESTLVELEAHIEMPQEFVVPGETPTSAALELARTILRRAERRTVALSRSGLVPGPHLIPYLNRLADLVWVLARAAERAESRDSTPARKPGSTARRENRT